MIFENYKSVWYTTLFFTGDEILNFLIREVNFENYKSVRYTTLFFTGDEMLNFLIREVNFG